MYIFYICRKNILYMISLDCVFTDAIFCHRSCDECTSLVCGVERYADSLVFVDCSGQQNPDIPFRDMVDVYNDDIPF